MSPDYRAQVLQAVDLVELISQTVALKRRGRNYVGLCPFHQEKTPSFHVNPGRQSFYCFGCKAGGTAFDFVMRRDRVEFKEALEILAKNTGIELPQFGGSKHKAGERQALLDANSAACRFFENLFWDPHNGQSARDYLHHRGFTDESLKQFQVGLALDAWDALLNSPIGHKFQPQVLAQAGLLKPRERGDGFYDTFRNRIIFPIRNEAAQIIAFGGRILPGSNDPAKYLNSPETPLFSKSKSLFGLDLARQRIVESRTVAVVEGYTDVVMAHQFAACNVVSVLGTALTEQHVVILRRFADRIVLLFDADSAGAAAVDRVVQLFLTQPVEIAVATLPDGLDPDEFLLKFGLETFDKLLADAPDALTYAWKQMARKFLSSNGLTDQQKAAAEYVDLLAKATAAPVDSIRLGSALARVSRLTQIPLAELHQRCRPRRPTRPAHAADQDPSASAAAPAAERPPSGQDLAECWILGILLLEPLHWQNVQAGLTLQDFVDPARHRLAELYWRHQQDEGEPVFSEFLAALDDETLRVLAIELVEEVEELGDLDARLHSAMEQLAELRRNRESQQTMKTLLSAKENPLTHEQENDLLKKVAQTRMTPDTRFIGPRIG
ncbi:MAG: DNA primase [Planctomycetota bacterium]|nr:DNA primase [Planctomycetota bacterium]